MREHISSFENIDKHLFCDDERMDEPETCKVIDPKDEAKHRLVTYLRLRQRPIHLTHFNDFGRACNQMYKKIMRHDERPLYRQRRHKVLKVIKSNSKRDYRLVKCALRSIYDQSMDKWMIRQRFKLLEYEYYARLSEITLAIEKMNLPPVVPNVSSQSSY